MCISNKMEEPQPSILSEKQKEESLLQEENNPEVIMDQVSTSLEPADLSVLGCDSTTEAEPENQLWLFVTQLTVRVLTKCHIIKSHSQEQWNTYTNKLVNQTMEGLNVTDSFCPDLKSTKKVCKAVLKDLHKKLGSKKLLETVILLQEPAVDTLIVRSLQARIQDLSARLAKKASNPDCWWKDGLRVSAFILGVLAALTLITFIP